MNSRKFFIIIFFSAIVLAAVSYIYLNRTPVRFFVLKLQADSVEAFRIDVYLDKPLSTVTSLHLSGSQAVEGDRALASENIYQMKTLASAFGSFDFVIGVSVAERSIDSFWNDFLNRLPTADSFTNLGSMDQFYLSLTAERKLTVSNSDKIAMSSLETPIPVAITPTSVVLVKKAEAEPTVRVEILNGCGIKGAADWVLSRVTRPTIWAKNAGNAVNFSYINSELLLSRSDFPNLEKALADLGFSKFSKIRSSTIPTGYDAVFIVGKDFQIIKGN